MKTENVAYITIFEVKVSKSRKKYGVLNSSIKRTKLTILSTQDSEFRLEDATIFFRDLLTY